jgi:peptide deformylase
MVAKVLKYGSTLLRKKSAEITNTDNLTHLSDNLFDTLKKEGGIGLAAPQIGILKRVFVMDSNPIAEDDETVEKFKRLVINPQIISRSQETILYSEGCLSIPGIYEEVERPKSITVKYLDESFTPVERELVELRRVFFSTSTTILKEFSLWTG